MKRELLTQLVSWFTYCIVCLALIAFATPTLMFAPECGTCDVSGPITVPEPGTLLLLGTGLAAIGVASRLRRRR